MTATHTAYPYGGKAHTSFVAYFQNIINHLAGQRLISGCEVARASASSLTVAAGSYTPATPTTTDYAGATLSGISACAASNHRYDLVCLDSADGAVKVATGTPAVPTNAAKFLENIAPQPPDMPSETAILLAVICVDENGIRSGDNEGSVAGCADMRMTTNIGSHLASYLYVASQARGDLMMRGASSWGRLGTSTIGKYLAAGGAGADLAWSDLLVGSLTCTSQTRGDLIQRGAAAWDRFVPGSANKYLMSNGTGNDLTYEDLKISSLTVTSQARGDLVMRGSTTWGRFPTGTAGQVLYSAGAGADLVWGHDIIILRLAAGDGGTVVPTGLVPGSLIKARANYTIVDWTLSEASASPIATTTVCDIVKKSSFSPAVTDSICASEKPSLTAATNATSSTLTGWTTTIDAGDWIALDVESNNNGKCLNLDLLLRRR